MQIQKFIIITPFLFLAHMLCEHEEHCTTRI